MVKYTQTIRRQFFVGLALKGYVTLSEEMLLLTPQNYVDIQLLQLFRWII